jgi:DNA invertase Pin-like site-specific DNA recombinase
MMQKRVIYNSLDERLPRGNVVVEGRKMKIIAYYRCSTKRQGASGLGLDAQQAAIESFAKANRGRIVAAYREIESGKRADRPELEKAVAHARSAKATLVVAKLDRLARNVQFTATLLNAGVEFVACDNPHANRLTIHILAAMAEHEAQAVSDRTKAALAAAKRRGQKLGSSRPGHWYGRVERRQLGQRKATKAAAVANRQRTTDAYRFVLPAIQQQREHGRTLQEIADWLNEQGHETTRHRPFDTVQVHRLLARSA